MSANDRAEIELTTVLMGKGAGEAHRLLTAFKAEHRAEVLREARATLTARRCSPESVSIVQRLVDERLCGDCQGYGQTVSETQDGGVVRRCRACNGQGLRRIANEAAERQVTGYAHGAWTPGGTEAPAAPGFFQPGRTYTDDNGYRAPELTTLFRVEHVTRHPGRGHLRAIGWMRSGTPNAPWHGHFQDEGEFDGWAEVREDGEPRG